MDAPTPSLCDTLYRAIKTGFQKIEKLGSLVNLVVGVGWNAGILSSYYTTEKYSTSCNSPLSFWLYGMAAIGFFVIVISLIGIFAVTYGQITGLQQNHVIRMSMLDDAGAELGEDEDPKYFNALEDPPQTVFENVNLTAGENLHLGILTYTARLGFIGSIALIVWLALGHLFYVYSDSTCNEALLFPCKVILGIYDGTIVLFIYKRIRN